MLPADQPIPGSTLTPTNKMCVSNESKKNREEGGKKKAERYIRKRVERVVALRASWTSAGSMALLLVRAVVAAASLRRQPRVEERRECHYISGTNFPRPYLASEGRSNDAVCGCLVPHGQAARAAHLGSTWGRHGVCINKWSHAMDLLDRPAARPRRGRPRPAGASSQMTGAAVPWWCRPVQEQGAGALAVGILGGADGWAVAG